VRFQVTPLAARPTLRRPCPSIQLIAGVQTVGGIIALLNDFLISKKRRPLGFLNPLLYRPDVRQQPDADKDAGLKDIISGSSTGCGTYGFSAVPGWELVRSSMRL
jgi:hypothetical protein